MCFLLVLMTMPALSDEKFSQCVMQLKEKAGAAGLSKKTVDILDTAIFQPEVIKLDRYQPEFRKTFANYINSAVSDARINQGKILLKTYAPFLLKLQKNYGIPPHILVAFWGLESNYGQFLNHFNIIDSLTTLACDDRRPAFFTTELLATLTLMDIYGFKREKLVGSWAGAVGHTQFLPSNYLAYAKADKGHSIPDLWENPKDALLSAAHFLYKLGWRPGWKWGREVIIPKGFNYCESGLLVKHSLSEWRKRGIKTVFNGTIPDNTETAFLILPGGHNNPAFLVYDNFNVILKWNRSIFYAVSVGYLADRLNNSAPLHTALKEEPSLSKATIQAIQEKLSAMGFMDGKVDGIPGPATHKAITAYQQFKHMVADGHPNADLLQSLGVVTK